MKQAIVTLAIGADYLQRFESCCRKDWTAYARRHGFDLIVFDQPLDRSERAKSRSPAWQKCLVLGAEPVADYDRVVWIDSDVCINPAAPSIVDGVPIERIGVTDENRFPTPEARQKILDSIIAVAPDDGDFDKGFWQAWRDPGAWHSYYGLPSGQAHIIQTGVMVFSPTYHRAVLERTYAHEDAAGLGATARAPGWGEMAALSHEIQSHELQHWIDPRFNALLWWLFLHQTVGSGAAPTPSDLSRFVKETYARSYFLHFAGAAHLMPLLSSINL